LKTTVAASGASIDFMLPLYSLPSNDPAVEPLGQVTSPVAGYLTAAAADAPLVGGAELGPPDGAVLGPGVQAAATIAKLASSVAIFGSRPEGRVMLVLLHSYPAPIGTRVPEIAG
jgi:hypothetical protein